MENQTDGTSGGEEIGDTTPPALPDKSQILLVYCRSGRRSKEASEKLAALGYTNVYEFGGILDWTGGIVKKEVVTEPLKAGLKLTMHINGEAVPVA